MKKTITIITSILFAVSLSAQIKPVKIAKHLVKAENNKIIRSGDEVLSNLMINPNPHTFPVLNSNSKSTITSEVIGWTTYDLQTNNSVQNRIVVHDNGTMSAAWTTSSELNSSWSDRGTGYNYYNGTAWEPAVAPPGPFTPRIEDSRVGWPSLLSLGNGGEVVMTHSTEFNILNTASRPSIGNGTWSNINVSEDYLIWNRSAAGGPDGNSIHMVALTEPSGGTWTGQIYEGLNGALLYFRSLDGGVSWDTTMQILPGMDSTQFIGFGGDNYAISARGETIALAYFNGWADSFIMKSTDNGETWTKTIFIDFPVDKYVTDSGLDLDSDGFSDTVYSTSNSGAILIDNNDMVHVTYGNMLLLDADLTDGGSSYFPTTNGLMYWNESMGSGTPGGSMVGPSLWDYDNGLYIAQTEDLDQSGAVELSINGGGNYGSGMTTMPNMGIDANGGIWVSYSTIVESVTNGDQDFRHIFITKSTDGGLTWSSSVDVTPHDDWNGMQECVYGSMSPVVDDKIRIVYQLDFEPGNTLGADADMVDYNATVYLEIDTVGLFDNTSTSVIELDNTNSKEDSRIFDLLGREWKSDFADLPKGVYIIDGKKVFKTK